jgi:hypothetical protein
LPIGLAREWFSQFRLRDLPGGRSRQWLLAKLDQWRAFAAGSDSLAVCDQFHCRRLSPKRRLHASVHPFLSSVVGHADDRTFQNVGAQTISNRRHFENPARFQAVSIPAL